MDAAEFSKLIRSNAPPSPKTGEDITAANFRSLMAETPKAEGMSWLDVPVQAITNIPRSGLEFGKGIYEAFTSPVQTAKGLLDIGAGTLRNVTPKVIADLIDRYDANPEAAQKASDLASQLGQFYKERYGSSEGFKQALAQDPVGVAADVSSVLSGGGAALGAASKTGKVAQLAAGLSRAGDITNPLLATAKTAKAVVTPALGLSTGTSAETVQRAAKAGFAGERPFIEQLRGQADMMQPLEDARHNLNVMRQNRSESYRSGMVDITGDKNVLSFDDIDKALNKTKAELEFKGKVKDDKAMAFRNEIQKEIDLWKKENPTEYHTPEGLDALKQRIGAIVDSVPYEERNSLRVGKSIYDSIKGTISKQAPKYAEVMRDYAEASDQIKEIEKALSLGNRSSADTAMRKLQSLNRNNVYTNYGNRLNLAQTLEAEGGRPFINALAGQSLSSPTARGMAGTVEGMTAVSGLFNPAALAMIPFQTPRIVGEGAYLAGRAARPVYEAGQAVGMTPTKALMLSDLLKTQQQLPPQEVINIQSMIGR